jgi:hypothetical protein
VIGPALDPESGLDRLGAPTISALAGIFSKILKIPPGGSKACHQTIDRSDHRDDLGESSMSDRKDGKSVASEASAVDNAARREALAKMGRLAGYTAPAMIARLGTTKARAEAPGSIKQK